MTAIITHWKHFFKSTDKSVKLRFAGIALLILLASLGAAVLILNRPKTEDQRFRDFTEQIFCRELSGNTLNLHYTLADPSDYGIDDSNITLGTMDQASWAASSMQAENYLSSLAQFSREELSPENQLTYDVLADYLNTSLEGADFYLYEEPLSPTLGIQAQLPVLLAEYTFRTKKDIEH